ncbi:calcium-binding protein [Shimia abyssi]|uniref:Ca2+-binding RTX toxin-like protein n=1 Tax=Shimia abyssi TaxID=1662395 RepID=A0A2P8FJR7_9RHOB|nr:calcium-binding protein [Shimia abyssi]PSL21966.1 Ca2+-binding RTX toxin-like protein [Shimia abyssi]
MDNLLNDTEERLTFEQYSVSDHWVSNEGDDGTASLSTSVETVLGVPYELEFNLAANLSASVQSVSVEVFFNGESIGEFVHDGGVFETYSFDLTGIGGTAQLSFEISHSLDGPNGAINATGVVPSISQDMHFMGEDVTVDAFEPGQSAIYQVLNGQLVKFDLDTNSYTEAEVPAAVNVNAIGFSAEDNLIYGIARSNGVDATGNPIARNDVVAIDARGATYAVSRGEMGSYIGDVDDNGNLWTFSGNLRSVVVYDLSESHPDGSLVHQTLSLPAVGLPTSGLADLAFHASSQTFFGVAHSGSLGQPGTLVSIDISEVALGGQPIVTTQVISGIIVDGEIRDGIPTGAFGATIVDGDGNVYIGANNTDHDLDSATPQSGGFYRVVPGADGGLYMELLADAPRVGSNDGAMDTRGVDPFLGIDSSSTVLLRTPVVSIAVAEDDLVRLAATGDGETIDLLANDDVSEGETLTLTHLNGQAVTIGDEITLENGEIVTYLGNGLVFILPSSAPRDVTTELTYNIVNQSGITDTATLTIETSPVQGTAGNDHMVGYVDADGTQIDGSDGANDVILGYGGNDKIFAGAGNDIVYGGVGNDFIRGQSGDDIIYGEDGRDVLDGGSGNDIMFGGAGNDTYFVDSLGDQVSEAGGDGVDTVKSRVDFTLDEGLENLWLLRGSDAIFGTGNAARNMIVGNGNDNVLRGMAGNDNLIGGSGNDTLYGGDDHDKLHGGDGADLLFGDAGNDKLHGGAGNDTAHGGDGNDTLCPGDGDDVMYGGDGNDLLSGNAGADIAYGGLGNDTYKVTDALDTIVEYADEGHDVVHAFADFSLSEHVEDLVFLGSGDLSGAGNDDANRLTGNTGDNVLSGNGGNDHIDGGAGDDVVSGDDGADKLLGRAGNDTLSGGGGDDTLAGGDGDDVLSGGIGHDFLCGDAGADTFQFQSGDGTDEIRAFDIVEDTVHLFDIQATSVAWAEDARGTRLVIDAEDSILFCGLSYEQLQSADIVFL